MTRHRTRRPRSLGTARLASMQLIAALAAPALAAGAVRDLSPLLEKGRAEQELPAVAAVVIEGGRVVASGAAGVRREGDPVPVTLDDRWHLGSCTKTMTATLVGVLVEEGALSFETTLAEALPHLAEEMHPDYRAVTVADLLAHRGGVGGMDHPAGLWGVLWKREGTPRKQRARMARAVLTAAPAVEAGRYLYSNYGYGIVGHVAETATGKSWEALMRRKLFEPLGMDSAGFGVPWDDVPPTDPWPHDAEGNALTPGSHVDNPPSIGPGGTVHASLGDWSKFIAEHLAGARGRKTKLLTAATWSRLHAGTPIAGTDRSYALGWIVLERPWADGPDGDDVGRALHHAGSNNSWFALSWIAPEHDLAVLCVTNIGGDSVFSRVDAVNGAVIGDHLERRSTNEAPEP